MTNNAKMWFLEQFDFLKEHENYVDVSSDFGS